MRRQKHRVPVKSFSSSLKIGFPKATGLWVFTGKGQGFCLGVSMKRETPSQMGGIGREQGSIKQLIKEGLIFRSEAEP